MRSIVNGLRRVLALATLVSLTWQMSWLALPTYASAAAPTVTPANMTVAGGSGTGGAFIIGDTAVALFNDSASAEPAATAVTIDFTEFGGGIQAAAETAPGSRIWQTTYDIVSGAIDTTTADIAVTATNIDGATGSVSDDENHIVDNQAPSNTGAGVLTINKSPSGHPGSGRVGVGDKVTFTGGTLEAADGAIWTVDLTTPNLTGEAALLAGSQSAAALENNLNGSYAFAATGTDNAGNRTTIAAGTNAITIDTQRPTITAAATETTSTILVDFSEALTSGSIGTNDFSVTNPTRTVSAVTYITATHQVRLLVSSAFSSGATPTVAIANDGGWGVYDAAGNKVIVGSSQVATDGVKPQVGPDVTGLTYDEGKNDRNDTLSVGFSENISASGGISDYIVTYDADGDFLTVGDQRPVAINAVTNPEGDTTVALSIADQSGLADSGGKFQVSVDTTGNVRDAAGNFVDPSAAIAISGAVGSFDSYAPTLTSAGLDPNTGLLGVGATITVYAETDDALNDQNLQTVSGTINGQSLTFAYNVGHNRYEATYTVTEGDSDATNVEALNIQLKDSAGNTSNILSTYGNSLSIDANTPVAPAVATPSTSVIVNAGSYNIVGTAEADTAVQIYTDPNNDGDKSDGTVVGSMSATGGNFDIAVSLAQDADNNFVVTATDAAGNESGATDVPTITEDSTAPSVHLNFPNGSERFAAGYSATITWAPATDAHLATNPVTLYYSTDGGATYPNVIDTNLPNTGSYSGWVVPSINSTTVMVKVAAADEAGNIGNDASDAVFTIDDSMPNSSVSADLQGQVYGPNTWDIAPISGQLSGTATDDEAGVDRVKLTIIDPNGLYWNGAGWSGTPDTVDAAGSGVGTIGWSYTLGKSNLVINNGSYTIAAQAIDDVDYGTPHEESPMSTGSFTWDNANPTVTITAPVLGAAWNEGNNQIKWTATDDHLGATPIDLEYSLDNGASWSVLVSDTANDGSYTWNIPNNPSYDTNQARVRLTATDEALNTTIITSDQFTIDTTNPTVSLDSPAGGSNLRGTVNLQATANDMLSGMDYVRFQYRPGTSGAWIKIADDASSAYEISWDTTVATDGGYQLRALAYDNAGNSTGSSVASVTIDNTSPDVDAGSDVVTNASFTQDGDADDATSGVASITWSQQSGPGTVTFGTPASEDTTISADTDGTYVIRLTVIDNAGNSAYDEMTLLWDTQEPSSIITTAGTFGPNTWGGKIVGTADDQISLSGVKEVNVKIIAPSGDVFDGSGFVAAGGGVVATGTNSWEVAITPAQLNAGGNGTYNIESKATDNAGNTESTGTSSFIWDATPPNAPTVNAVASPVNADNQTVTGTAEANSLVTITGGASTVTQQLSGGATAYSIVVPLTQDADNNLDITATDAVNNVSVATSVTIVEDSTPPATPVVTAPASQIIIDASAYNVEGTAENGTTVTVYTDLNNDGDKSDGGLVTSGPASPFSITTTLTADSNNDFVVTATDAAGNESTGADIARIVEDSTDPVVTVSSPNGGDIYAAGSTQNITWTASDSNFGATPIELHYSTDGFASSDVQIAANEVNDGNYVWVIPSALHSQTVTVRVIAIDQVNRIGRDDSDATFTVDNTLPSSTVSTTGTYGPNTWSGSVDGTADDPSGFGLREVRVTIAAPTNKIWTGSDWQTTPTPDYVIASGTTSWSVSLLVAQITEGDGTYNIISKTVDLAGNTESTGTGSFVWDATPPNAPTINAVTSPVNAPSQTITGTAEANSLVTITGGASTVTQQLSGGATSYSISVNLNQDADNELEITATDAANNTSAAILATITEDSTAPANNGAGTSPDGQTFDTNGILVFEGTAEEGVRVYLEIESQIVTRQIDSIDSTSKWRFEVPASEVGPGEHHAYITITDKAGNSSGRVPVASFTIKEAPVVLASTATSGVETVAPQTLTPAAKEEVKEAITNPDEGVIKAAEDTVEESSTVWQTVITVLAILIIAVGVGTAGYYGYEWWLSRNDAATLMAGGAWDEDNGDEKEAKVAKKTTSRKKSSVKKSSRKKRSGGNRSSNRW